MVNAVDSGDSLSVISTDRIDSNPGLESASERFSRMLEQSTSIEPPDVDSQLIEKMESHAEKWKDFAQKSGFSDRTHNHDIAKDLAADIRELSKNLDPVTKFDMMMQASRLENSGVRRFPVTEGMRASIQESGIKGVAELLSKWEGFSNVIQDIYEVLSVAEQERQSEKIHNET